MEYNHMHLVAKKIASVLAENEATVEDINEIFKLTKRHLTVEIRQDFPRKNSFGKIFVPDQSCDEDGIGD